MSPGSVAVHQSSAVTDDVFSKERCCNSDDVICDDATCFVCIDPNFCVLHLQHK